MHLSNVPPQWQLYGTLGCHLCEQAEQLIQQFSQTRIIHLKQIDIAELSNPLMNQWAARIPVLVTAQVTLNWPFSLLDLMQAYQQELAHD